MAEVKPKRRADKPAPRDRTVRQLPLFSEQPQTPDDLHPGTPFAATLDLFAAHLRQAGKSDHTITAFAGDLLLVGEFLGDETPLRDFSTHDLDAFLHWLEHGRDVPCSRKSYARRVTTLKVYFKWLHSLGAIIHDPAKAVIQRSGPAPLSDVLSPAQYAAALEAARAMRTRKGEPDTRPELLLRLLVDTGIKKNETMSLTPDSVERGRAPQLTVRFKVRNVFKERNIALDPDWARLLDLYLAQYAPKTTIFDCTSRNLEYILTDVGALADLPFKLSFEVLRWTCGVRDLRAGMDEEAIRQKLGLSEISWHETGHKLRQLVAQQLEEE
jgi:integrase/recombinase XerD